jgi:hypothetical protein
VGFQRPHYRLLWPDGHELHGLEVVTKGLSIGDLKLVAGLAPGAGVRTSVDDLDPLLDVFARSLISWNFEDENGVPVGTSREDLARQDMRLLMPIVMTWIGEVSTIPAPLSRASSDGERFPTDSIPMESLSPNLENSNTPN